MNKPLEQITLPGGKKVNLTPVTVEESTERWSDVRLADGVILRIKPVIVGADRIEGEYDPEGNPTYRLKSSVIMVIEKAPEELKKKP